MFTGFMSSRNRQPLIIAILVLVLGAGTAWVRAFGNPFRHPVVPHSVEVFFSPKGGCTAAVVEALRGARKSVLVQAFSFTNAEIAKALVEAHRRGVKVEIILDRSQQRDKYTEADFTAHAGIPTWIDAAHAIAHNKVMVIDGEAVITGSFNFTRQAEVSNAENLVVIHQTPEIAKLYTSNWEEHRGHSTRFSREASEEQKSRSSSSR